MKWKLGTPHRAFAALVAAGFLWGTTVPLSKVALDWLPPAWLTFARFAVAAIVLLVDGRSRLRAAFSPSVLASGAIGYGGSVLLQNAGITRTSVSHAALLVGAVPVLVAVIAALWHRAVARPLAWAGFAVSLAGVSVVTSGGSGSTGGGNLAGDGLVLLSVFLSASLMVAQTRLLRGRDPVAVTAAQFLGAAAAVLPVAAFTEGGAPPVPGNPGVLLATVALAVGGTLAPFTLFAYGQSRVPAEVAGAFVNIEPVVGAVAGVVIFGDPAGFWQVVGALAILVGIAMSTMPGPRRSSMREWFAVLHDLLGVLASRQIGWQFETGEHLLAGDPGRIRWPERLRGQEGGDSGDPLVSEREHVDDGRDV
jgi:O-acetylserine/cysteine efflux transporter